MNPNDLLAGINVCIAAAMLCLGIIFFTALLKEGKVQGKLRRVFTFGMGVAYVLLTLDYGTTGTLRFIDLYAIPHIPHSLLPDPSVFPFGIAILVVWRFTLAVVLWAIVLYVLIKNQDTDIQS